MKKHFLIVLALILAVLSFSSCASKHEHAWSEWKTAKEATCGEDGEQTRTCECGETEKQTVPAKGTGHVFGEWVTTTPATKTEPGLKEQTCTVCGGSNKEIIPILVSEGLEFTQNTDGTYSISGIGTCQDTVIVIPAVYNGEPVTSIGDSAFYGCSSLTSVVIPDSVTSIGNYAFSGCSSLTSIVIPESVTSIGHQAFWSCSSLTSIVIPESVTSIGHSAFSGCSSLTSIVIPESVTSIGVSPFGGCSSLTEISVHKNNKYYCSENGILFNKTKTELICYPAGKTETSYSIPASVTSIGDGAFRYCSRLTSIVIPDRVTSIGNYAFQSCSSLTSIVIPDSVTSIDGWAFLWCSSLTNIVIPDSVTSIGNYAFSYCSSLTSIQFGGTTAQWKSISLGSGWNANTGKYTITCTDGAIAKNGTVTYN